MHKVAILLDGGHALMELRKARNYPRNHIPRPEEIEDLARLCCRFETEQLFRIYYYDCEPFEGTAIHPLSNQQIDFTDNPTYRIAKAFYGSLAQAKNLAFRAGQLKFQGWGVKDSSLRRLMTSHDPLTAEDLKPEFQQKGVDIKIGLDISWLASKHIVDRIILFTGDTDFIPAMKYARREGIQVVLASLQESVNPGLREHSDDFRRIELSR